MAACPRQTQAARWARSALPVAFCAAVTVAAVVLLALSQEALASHAERPAGVPYQVTLGIGTGAQYELLQGSSLALPITVSVPSAVALASATMLMQYDPLELRPVACVRQPGAPSGYCNIAWDTAAGLVRFSILSADGVLGSNVGLFTLTFEPAPTATLRRVTSVTPLLESIADVQGNYMTSWMLGSTVRVMPSTPAGAAVYVGGLNSPKPINITRGMTATVPIVVTGVTGVGLGSASFSLSFDPAVVRPLECRPVQLAAASGTCALHADHVSANVLSTSASGTGLLGTIPAFEVVYTTGPTAIVNDVSALDLTLSAFADMNGAPITVSLYNNSLKVIKTPSAVVPMLRMTPTDQYLLNDQRINLQVILDNGTDLAAGDWGIRYDPTIVEAEACQLSANGFCNATGQAGVVRMTVLSAGGGPPPNIGTITFRRHPQGKASQKTSLAFEVTNFASLTDDQLSFRTLSASITLADTLGSGPAVSMHLVGVPPYQLYQGASLDLPIDFTIDPGRPVTNLTGSLHYDPRVLRPTRCVLNDLPAESPTVFCNAQYDREQGVIRFTLLAAEGFTGSLTPFVLTFEPTSTSRAGDNSPLHFTVEAIEGPGGEPRTWAATDETILVKGTVPAPRVLVGPPEMLSTAIYTVALGTSATVPMWVEAVPDLGAGTVEVRYDATVVRATKCTLRSDLTPALDGGFCSLLDGAVRLAFVASQGITGTTQLYDIEFAQAPNAVSGQTSPLDVIVQNFVDTAEVPIPTSGRNGRLDISCYAEPVTDLRIARDGDNLQLTWSHVGSTASRYQVWRADVDAYFAFGDIGSTAIATVLAPPSSTSASYASIGAWADNLNHYYMVRAMCATNQGSLRSNRVGKFTRPIGFGMNMVSLPLVSLPQLPYSLRVQDVVGAQLTGEASELHADRVWAWDTARQDYSYAWLIADAASQNNGKWWEGATWQESAMMLPPNTGFWVQSRHQFTQTVKMLGNVAEPNTQGLYLVKAMQMIGSAYPNPVVLSLDAATFIQDGAHQADSELKADRIWYWDESRQDYVYAWLKAGVGPEYGAKWWEGATWSESQITLQPGVGYWYQRRAALGFGWSNPGPIP